MNRVAVGLIRPQSHEPVGQRGAFDRPKAGYRYSTCYAASSGLIRATSFLIAWTASQRSTARWAFIQNSGELPNSRPSRSAISVLTACRLFAFVSARLIQAALDSVRFTICQNIDVCSCFCSKNLRKNQLRLMGQDRNTAPHLHQIPLPNPKDIVNLSYRKVRVNRDRVFQHHSIFCSHQPLSL